MTREPVNIFEYEELAKANLPKPDYDFIAGGATDEITLRRTRAVYDSIMLRPNVMVDISNMDLSTTVLGHEIALPVLLDPAGNHSTAHPDAELATARAAGAVGTVMALSSSSSHTLEDVAEAASGPLWFQQYIYKDPGLTLEMAARAEEAGYSAICLTVDAKVLAKRERNIRNDYVGGPAPNYAHLNRPRHTWKLGSDTQTRNTDIRSQAAAWPDLEWLAANTRLPVVVKGVLAGEDGKRCADHGAKGVIVSNHGARYLDTALATIEALPDVVESVAGRIEVYLDGGIRRGSDIYKALALGARAVLIGRPIFWGLAVNGEAGLVSVLNMLRDELDGTMAMCGRPSIDSIDRGSLLTVSPLLGLFPQPPSWREA